MLSKFLFFYVIKIVEFKGVVVILWSNFILVFFKLKFKDEGKFFYVLGY